MNDGAAPPPSSGESALERSARRKFGLRLWDRPALFRETADAATDTDLPFWAVLFLSGAIATLGLALDAAAVVIGAMLIAPLLGPLLGLSLALTVGDGRLAVQTALAIALGALGVVLLAALLTLVLPFHDVTGEIAARTRPTTLDLAIAIASGLAGAVVTVSREQRLSASIPGVAIAVALIPPLGVAGFGIGTGWQWPLIRGSMLLFGANFAGIVLSGMLVFLVVGMHRPDVVTAARQWHADCRATGLALTVENWPGLSRVGVFGSLRARTAMMVAFIIAVAIPLGSTLGEIVREARVSAAVEDAARAFEIPGRAFVLNRDITYGDGRSEVRLRVATTEWLGAAERARFETAAAAAAHEPVALELEQVPVSAGALDSLSDATGPLGARQASSGTPAVASPADAVRTLREQLDAALSTVALPDSVRVLGGELTVGMDPTRLTVEYAAPAPIPADAEVMLARQAAKALGLDPAHASASYVTMRERPLAPDSATQVATLTGAAGVLRRYPDLALDLVADSVAGARARQVIARSGIAPQRIRVRHGAPSTYRFIVTAALRGG